MAEVHAVGQLVSGTGFRDGSCLLCKFQVEAGSGWRVLGGAEVGQTQAASGTRVLGSRPCPSSSSSSSSSPQTRWFWSHPVDLHFATRGIQGWPRIVCQVFHLDAHGRCVLEGYGVSHLPAAPGLHQLAVPCWRPCPSSLRDRLARTFLGGSVVLRNPQNLLAEAEAEEQRYKLKTTASGTVNLELTVVARHFDKFGVHLGS